MRILKFLKIFSIILSLMLIFNAQFVWAETTQPSTSKLEQVTNSVPDELQPLSLTTDGSSMGKFYSTYSSSGLYNVVGSQLWENSLQSRTNCYGYAFRFFYAPDVLNSDYGYLQQPGEFADKTNGLEIEYETDSFDSAFNREQLDSLYTEHFSDLNLTNAYRMNIMDQLIKADAAALGYTITEYTGTTIPSAQTYSDRRLIAMVVGDGFNRYGSYSIDFHFYMQHSDNTWSHKTGGGNTYTACLDHGTLLTNDTIQSHACEYSYQGYFSDPAIKFYYISKDAISDYRHMDGTAPTCTSTSIRNYDLAGDYLCAAKDIGTLPEDYIYGNIDYIGDVDYYVFEAETNGTRTIYVESPSNLPSTYAKIYDQNGTLLDSASTINGLATLSVNLTASQKYYLSFSCPNQIDYVFNKLVYMFY